jgi:hypothetical protein
LQTAHATARIFGRKHKATEDVMTRDWNLTDRQLFLGGSDAPIDQGALLRLWQEKHGEAKPDPEVLSGKPCPTQPCDRASAKRSASLVRAAHAKFVGALTGCPPRPIPLDADAIDLEDRADHLDKVLNALSVYVTVILDDTAQNVPGGLDLPHIEAVLADLASDVTGAIQHAAEGMGWRIA